MKSRVALVLIGAWLTGTVCVSVVATQNFYTVDRMLTDRANATFSATADNLGQPRTRDLLRFLSSELNRLYFRLWNVVQLMIGGVTLWLVWEPKTNARWLVAAMFASTVVVAALTPEIVSLGRSLDFVARDPAPPGMSRFWMLHAAYTSLEMIKLTIGFVAAILLVREPAGREGFRAPT